MSDTNKDTKEPRETTAREDMIAWSKEKKKEYLAATKESFSDRHPRIAAAVWGTLEFIGSAMISGLSGGNSHYSGDQGRYHGDGSGESRSVWTVGHGGKKR